jgi:hypothetical protein
VPVDGATQQVDRLVAAVEVGERQSELVQGEQAVLVPFERPSSELEGLLRATRRPEHRGLHLQERVIVRPAAERSVQELEGRVRLAHEVEVERA